MERLTTVVTRGGRVILPAKVRKELDIHDGEPITIEVEGNTLRLVPLKQQLAAVQARCAGLRPSDGSSAVDQLIAERREDARKEFAE